MLVHILMTLDVQQSGTDITGGSVEGFPVPTAIVGGEVTNDAWMFEAFSGCRNLTCYKWTFEASLGSPATAHFRFVVTTAGVVTCHSDYEGTVSR